MEGKKMRGAVLRAFGQPLSVEMMDIPTPGPGEALVKVMASGLCPTDLHIQEGLIKSVTPPYTPGHEMAGIICALGSDVQNRELTVGTHVLCAIDVVCGTCALCKAGRENLCLRRVRVGFERDGSHAEYAVVPYDNLLAVPDSMPFEQAAIIPDAVVCMYHAIKGIADVRPGERVLFYGAGALGLQGIQIAKHFGCEVYASARTQEKLDVARSLGADATINIREQDILEEIRRLTGGDMCDAIFDLVGTAHSIDDLLALIRPGGKVVALAYGDEAFVINSQELVVKEKQVLGIRGATRQDLLEAIDLVVQGKVVPCVSTHYRLEDINEALDALRACKSLGRSVIMFD